MTWYTIGILVGIALGGICAAAYIWGYIEGRRPGPCGEWSADSHNHHVCGQPHHHTGSHRCALGDCTHTWDPTP
jgi:hypothetical protein